MWHSQNKYYSTRKVSTQLGKFDSKFEASYAQELDLRLKAKDIKGFESHLSMPLIVNNYHIGDYQIDFAIYHNDGTIEYVECKGFPTAVWRLKWKIFCAMHEDNPNEKITLIWQSKNYPKLRKIKKVN